VARSSEREGLPISGFDVFGDFFRRDFAGLVAFLVAAGAGRAEAEDAAQEAMVAAHRHWPELDHPKAWVRTVAWRDVCRRRRRLLDGVRRAVLGGWAEETAPRASVDSVLEGLYVLGLLARLTPRRRAVMALHLEGFDATEIAAIVAMTPATVRSHLRHAREQLRGLVAESRVEG